MQVKTYFSKDRIVFMDTDKIKADTFLNINRIRYESVLKTAEIIKNCGLIAPVLLRPDLKNKNLFYLISNPEIFSALLFLQVKRVPVLVLHLTEPEAALFYFTQNKNLDIFEKAELIKFLTAPGRYKISELCDILKISSSALESMLLPLVLSENEKRIFIRRNMGIKILKEYIKVTPEKKEEILNKIVAEDMSEIEGIKLIKDLLSPKSAPQKHFTLKNDTIIMNSINRVAENLKSGGLSVETQRNKCDKGYEYKIILKGDPQQQSFECVFDN